MKENIRESAKNLGFPDDADLNKMFGFDVKYDNIDDGGIGGTRITDSGLTIPKLKSHKPQIQQIGKHMSFESLKKRNPLWVPSLPNWSRKWRR